jgi:hypothetical protein
VRQEHDRETKYRAEQVSTQLSALYCAFEATHNPAQQYSPVLPGCN